MRESTAFVLVVEVPVVRRLLSEGLFVTPVDPERTAILATRSGADQCRAKISGNDIRTANRDMEPSDAVGGRNARSDRARGATETLAIF